MTSGNGSNTPNNTANNGEPNIAIETESETENYLVWSTVEPDGEKSYHVELGPVTAHFFREEWAEFVNLIRQAGENPQPEEGEEDTEGVQVELDWGTLDFSDREWAEFIRLINGL